MRVATIVCLLPNVPFEQLKGDKKSRYYLHCNNFISNYMAEDPFLQKILQYYIFTVCLSSCCNTTILSSEQRLNHLFFSLSLSLSLSFYGSIFLQLSSFPLLLFMIKKDISRKVSTNKRTFIHSKKEGFKEAFKIA